MSKIQFKCKCGVLLKFDFKKDLDKFQCSKCGRKYARYYDASYDTYTWDEVKDERG